MFSADGGEVWENNFQRDFRHKVLGGPREDAGTISTHELPSPDPAETVTVRIWTPPGFDATQGTAAHCRAAEVPITLRLHLSTKGKGGEAGRA